MLMSPRPPTVAKSDSAWLIVVAYQIPLDQMWSGFQVDTSQSALLVGSCESTERPDGLQKARIGITPFVLNSAT